MAAVVFVTLAVYLLGGLSRFGIWDPWELTTADAARDLLEGTAGETVRPPLSAWLVARAFAAFGIDEWSGRMPIALTGLALIGLTIAVGRFFGDLRRGTYAALILGTTPFVLLHARHMVGHAPSMLFSTLVFAAAAGAAFAPQAERRWASLAVLVPAIGLATLSSGMLLGVAPPLLAVFAAVVSRLPWHDRPLAPLLDSAERRMVLPRLVLGAVATVVSLGVVRAIAADAAGFSYWTGGVPARLVPPSFEVPIEAMFHGFAPWTALIPLALGFLVVEDRQEGATPHHDSEHPGRGVSLAAMAWCGLALLAQSLFSARYGTGVFLAPFGLAWLIASMLRGVERTSRGENWARGLVVLLLSGLTIRDFAGYPGTPLAGLGLSGLTVPAEFNPRLGWAALLAAFGLAAFFGFATNPRRVEHDRLADAALAPLDLIKAQWALGWGVRGWVLGAALLLAACLGFGALCVLIAATTSGLGVEETYATAGRLATGTAIGGGVACAIGIALAWVRRGRAAGFVLGAAIAILGVGLLLGTGLVSLLGIDSLILRIGRVLLVVPFAIPIGIVLGGIVYRYATSLGEWMFAPMLATALVLGGWFVFGFHAQASEHFSPRQIYDTYNALSQAEPLGEYQVGGRAAAYYTEGEIVALRGEHEAVEFLARPSRVWIALPAEQLGQLDRAFRARTNRHLFIADARSGRVLLGTNLPIDGRADENYLADVVLDQAPPVQFPVHANLDRRVELVGINLRLPNGDSVGRGEAFTVEWIWHCITPVPGGYQPFLHVDGHGQRLNGDHEPVDGRYPVRMWSPGDYIIDRQQLRVPGNFPAGDYTFFTGLYAGESRLEVVEGPEDDANRIAAGTLRVR